jgi:ElaB/YqjD/DUF883 family membrane-anchored ribosome-binding protein
MNRLEAEIARRDAALTRVRENVTDLKQDISEKVTETKAVLSPKNIAENIRTEYGPEKLVSNYPWASVLVAMAAGFAVVPLFKRVASSIPSEPAPPPQRVIIELKGAGQVVHSTAGGHAPESVHHKASFKEILADGAALISSFGAMMQHFNPGTHAQAPGHNGGNGGASSESRRF